MAKKFSELRARLVEDPVRKTRVEAKIKSLRQTVSVDELSDEEFDLIETAEVPAEHRYSLCNDEGESAEEIQPF